ncbi:hypothetical protein BCV71DRAFT_231352 [Rhizopus microsporus]|uniref:F-box domain-containing protein n=1 Tax=Rhizopus microsporus TaxID=58291 RepID=A0A1X0SDU5_RHIZD|nr:hypothetical protein BCV71DRAFT_231352 [Rhizopus microsporus]
MYLSTYSSLYFIIDTYHLEFSTVKVSLERSTRKTIKHKPELDAYALNPSFKTYQPILDIDKLDINIDLVAESVGMTSSVCSFIQKCYRLQELYFSIHANFFRNLSTSCPNLKELRLRDITTYNNVPGDDRHIIDLKDMTLQSLWLTLAHEKRSYYRMRFERYIEIPLKEEMQLLDFDSEDHYSVFCHHIDELVLNPSVNPPDY